MVVLVVGWKRAEPNPREGSTRGMMLARSLVSLRFVCHFVIKFVRAVVVGWTLGGSSN